MEEPHPAQPPTDPGAVTILRPVDRRRLMTKEYTLAANGKAKRREFSEARTFSVEQRHVDGIAALHWLLTKIERDPAAFIIRGEPFAATDRSASRRLLHDRPADERKGEPAAAATYFDVPRAWLMLDADKIALPSSASVINDPADVAQSLVDLFAGYAPELEGVTAVVQFSSSAGIAEMAEAEITAGLPDVWSGAAGKGGTVSAHIWFWLAEPQDGAALKRWAAAINAKAGSKVIDAAMFSAVQVHYCAGPIFSAGLRDPLAGRRVMLVKGHADAATLEIPVEAPRVVYTGGGLAVAGVGFDARLDAIGRTGFNLEINSAIASFVASNWPNPDTEALIGLLQARIETADAGGRSQAQMDAYKDARSLRRRIDWTVARERMQREEAARIRAEAEARNAIAPTFPDKAVTLAEGRDLAAAAVAEFADKMRAGERPEMLLRLTVGAGKSEAAIRQAPALLDAAREGGREGALYYMVPRHDLGSEIAARLSAAHGGKPVAIWRGMDADDPDAPGFNDPAIPKERKIKMCRDPELPATARAAGLSAGDACNGCPLQCRYRNQRGQKADVWLGAHNMAFQGLPKALPAAAAVVIDEAFWPAAVKGWDGAPIQLALSALGDTRTGMIPAADRERLLYLRHKAALALRGGFDGVPHEAGGLLRSAFAAVGMTADDAAEWEAAEWDCKPRVKLAADAGRAATLTALRDAAEHGFNRLRPVLARHVRELLAGDAARSVNATFVPDADLGRGQGSGPAIRFEWREDFAPWAAEAPKLLLDATTHPELARIWAPDLRVVDIEIEAPALRLRQVVGAEFGKSFFTRTPGNVERLADLVMVEAAEAAGGGVLVITQKEVEAQLWAALVKRHDGGTLPPGVELAHHGNVTGIDRWRDVARLVVVGRPAMNRTDGERLAEIVAGKPVAVTQDGDRARWPTVTAGIRRPDGKATPVEQPRHADPLVEGIRWSITEGAILQAIGRARAVQRAEPVHVTLLAQFALPITVATVEDWHDAIPDRLTVAAAEAAIGGKALPLAPADLAAARPDLWPTPAAAEKDMHRSGKAGHSLIDIPYKDLSGFSRLTPARYRKPGARRWSMALVPAEGGEQALAAIVGPLAAYETVAEAAGKAQAGVGAAAAASPAADPAEALVPAEVAGARLFHLGDDPPLPGEAIGSLPTPASVPPASAVALLTELTIRLEAVKPPRLHGDGMDLVRIDWWHERRAAARARWPVPLAAADAVGAARGAAG